MNGVHLSFRDDLHARSDFLSRPSWSSERIESIESSMRHIPPRVRRYVGEIAFWHGVNAREILSRNRAATIAAARADVMRRLRRDGFSTPQIGRWLDRDHSTIIHHTRGI